MKLPNRSVGVVPQSKLAGYLLSSSHPYGRHKAAFFTSFGFSLDLPEALAYALLEHANSYEVAAAEHTRFGTRYVVEGPLTAPDGRTPLVRVVWFIRNGEVVPILATAYPMRRTV